MPEPGSQAIYSWVRQGHRERTVVAILESLIQGAIAWRQAEHEHRWERCKRDRAILFPSKYLFEQGRSHRFLSWAKEYGNTLSDARKQALMPSAAYLQCEATTEAGEEHEQAMQQEILHVLELGRFEDAVNRSNPLFLTNGFVPVLVVEDLDNSIWRPQILDPANVWADHEPMEGTLPERIWRAMRLRTTLPDLLREQQESGGRKYHAEQLDKLKDRTSGTRLANRQPKEFDLWIWWGDLYMPDPKGGPSRIVEQCKAIWAESILLSMRDIDTPKRVPELHLLKVKDNIHFDPYGEPDLWAGHQILNAAVGYFNQGIDWRSRKIKGTVVLRKGSYPDVNGIEWGRPIVTENPQTDVDLNADAGGGANLVVFEELAKLELMYAKAIGSPLTHSIHQQPRTAKEVGVEQQVIDTNTTEDTKNLARAWEPVLLQMQQLRARDLIELASRAAAGDPSAEQQLPQLSRRRNRSLDDDGGWGDVKPEAWMQQYTLHITGSGMVAPRMERMAGAQMWLQAFTLLAADDPVLKARLKKSKFLKQLYHDATGQDHDEMLHPLDQVQEMFLQVRQIVEAEIAEEMAAATDPAAGGGVDPSQPTGKPNGGASGNSRGVEAATRLVGPA